MPEPETAVEQDRLEVTCRDRRAQAPGGRSLCCRQFDMGMIGIGLGEPLSVETTASEHALLDEASNDPRPDAA